MTNTNPNIQILKDLDEISRRAADLFVETAAQAIAQRGRFLAALSGGNTPMGLFRLLAAPPYRDQVNWSKTHLFWGDERCVPPDDPGSSYGEAKKVLLDNIPIPAENVHRIVSDPSTTLRQRFDDASTSSARRLSAAVQRGGSPSGDFAGQRLEPAAAATDYARVLKVFSLKDDSHPPLDWPRFDLVLLGMGDDAHTASLFPGSPVDVSTPTLAVTAQYQDRPAQRITLTPMVINAARRIVFLVSGASKAEPLVKVLFGDYHPENLPAQRIKPTDGEVIWLVDEAAGSKLRN